MGNDNIFRSIIFITLIIAFGIMVFPYILMNDVPSQTQTSYQKKTDNAITHSDEKAKYERTAKLTGKTKGVIIEKKYTPSKSETSSSTVYEDTEMTVTPLGPTVTLSPSTKYETHYTPSEYTIKIKCEEYAKVITIDDSNFYDYKEGTDIPIDVYTYEDGGIKLVPTLPKDK